MFTLKQISWFFRYYLNACTRKNNNWKQRKFRFVFRAAEDTIPYLDTHVDLVKLLCLFNDNIQLLFHTFSVGMVKQHVL